MIKDILFLITFLFMFAIAGVVVIFEKLFYLILSPFKLFKVEDEQFGR